MRKIEILDCTLRDGGYVNDNRFGFKNMKEIIKKLEKANIDIIECGYLSDDKETYDKDITEFRVMEELQEQKLINTKNDNLYTLMLLGEKYKIENLKESKDSKNNIIRMSFHKHSLPKAIEYSKIILNKGYRLFLQPTVIMNYKEDEIIAMLKAFNELDVMGVAIVDTFGQMVPDDTKRMVKLFDQYLRKDIRLAFHAHNNLQMAFANAITFISSVSEDRAIVIDSSLYGMGRGAGNLPTELLANYLNENYQKNYKIDPILEICDTVIDQIKNEHPWGYSLPYYLSAKYACHPSYVLHLLNRKMLDSSDINNVLKMISSDKITEYDKNYMEDLYLAYSENSIEDANSYIELQEKIKNKNILLIGPGHSVIDYNEKIEQYIKENNCYTIVVNNPDIYLHDAVFYSNKKRYSSGMKEDEVLEIITSNISTEKKNNRIIFDYRKSLSNKLKVSDSSLLILLSILEKAGVKKIVLAGFDGFSETNQKNYYSNDIAYVLDKNLIADLNRVLKENIEEYQKVMDIKSLTPSINIKEVI